MPTWYRMSNMDPMAYLMYSPSSFFIMSCKRYRQNNRR
jgi:hypothetical protein